MKQPKTRWTARGVTAVEFALLLGVMVMLLLGAVDMARWLVASASLHEAARAGARMAVVCDLQDPDVAGRAVERLVALSALASAPTLSVVAEPIGCSAANCTRLRVTLSGAALNSLLPAWGGQLPLPAAHVELPRESLSSRIDGRSNPSCL
ncbi:MAG: TadE/TadG family type IV pilus assembly protein [Burkholderiaceae bacterium]|jgi:Flp pilus assembly protein TadG